ncbi:MAG: nucleotide-binding universal stress UspA family protein [Paracoccaceae bacterium]|jgi:nucleotide-binding universal stress UspA family protein
MAYQSIATIVTKATDGAPHLEATATLATRLNAHLDVICVGIDRSRPDVLYSEMPQSLDVQGLKTARTEADTLAEHAEQHLKGADARWEVRTLVVQPSGLSQAASSATQLADLTVLPRPYGNTAEWECEAIAEAALFNGPNPVLFTNDSDSSQIGVGPVILGWNESAEALGAVRGALPFLKTASIVYITIVAPSVHSQERSDPGGRLARMLTRHGVKVEVSILAQTLPRASDELLRHAREKGAGLIVVGAYSHSRLREAIFGGATRSLLTKSDIPLLMAH